MCGIAGILRPAGSVGASHQQLAEQMAATLAHRGPDDCGGWSDVDAGIALGHRRLSVVDLSREGRQPMSSASGRYVIVLNGEIYNHLEIREELMKSQSTDCVWRGHSDTETLLAGIERWGVHAVLKKIAGMFAFALWDRARRTLTLARDRIGEKPLYYGWQGDVFLFGSELKALRVHPLFRANIDRNVLAMYVRRGYVVAPHSIYQGIFKLLPGTYMEFSGAMRPGVYPAPQVYWSLREIAERGLVEPFRGFDEEAVAELESALSRAVCRQSVADVPLGAFLSGGIDSSTVVALMQAQSVRAVKTFTIGFRESDYQEAKYAKSIANYLGTDHTELYVTPDDAMQVIPKLPRLFDEPFGDSSAVPMYLVAQLARQNVTVALSGDGGDELFAGYTRYQRTNEIWRVMKRIPLAARRVLCRGMQMVYRSSVDLPLARTANRLGYYLCAENAEECYREQILQHRDDLVLGSDKEQLPGVSRFGFALPRGNLYASMMYTDTMTYLPDDILVKVDRACMGVGLESRVPMLDPGVLTLAWTLPLQMKVRRGESKWALKQVLKKYVPPELTERRKMGFGIPVGQWMRGPLRDWAEDLLSEGRLQTNGFFRPDLVRTQWQRHLGGSNTEGDSLWQVLMFQAWLAYTHP